MVDPLTLDEETFRRFVDDYRVRCLWFYRADYYPVTSTERERVLRLIERYGDRSSLARAAAFRTWLSRPTNETSVAC